MIPGIPVALQRCMGACTPAVHNCLTRTSDWEDPTLTRVGRRCADWLCQTCCNCYRPALGDALGRVVVLKLSACFSIAATQAVLPVFNFVCVQVSAVCVLLDGREERWAREQGF